MRAVALGFPAPSPLRGEIHFARISTGSAAGGFAAAPLHPWLQSVAPSGALREYSDFRSEPQYSTAAKNQIHTPLPPHTCACGSILSILPASSIF